MKIALEQIREQKKYRLEDIAEKLDVAVSTVQRWEKGKTSIPTLKLTEIAAAYGCLVSEIFTEDELPPPPDEAHGELINMYESISYGRREAALRMAIGAMDVVKREDGNA